MATAALSTIIRRVVWAGLLVVVGLLTILWGATGDYSDIAVQTTPISVSVAPTCAPDASASQCAVQP
jgi:hypothetical protein